MDLSGQWAEGRRTCGVGGSQCWQMFAGPTLQLYLESFWVSHLLHILNKEFLISRVSACEHKDTWSKAEVF